MTPRRGWTPKGNDFLRNDHRAPYNYNSIQLFYMCFNIYDDRQVREKEVYDQDIEMVLYPLLSKT